MGEVGSGAVRLTYVRRGVLGYKNKNVARSFDFYISCRSKEWQGRRLIETHNSLAHSVRLCFTVLSLYYVLNILYLSPYTCLSIYISI